MKGYTVIYSSGGIGDARTFFCEAPDSEQAEFLFERSGLPGEIVWVSETADKAFALREWANHGCLNEGDRVFWNDPDGGACSQAGVVSEICGEVVRIQGENDPEIECVFGELDVLV